MDFLEALAVPCIRAKVCLASLKTSEGSPSSFVAEKILDFLNIIIR